MLEEPMAAAAISDKSVAAPEPATHGIRTRSSGGTASPATPGARAP